MKAIKKSLSIMLAVLLALSAFAALPLTASAEAEAKVTLTSKQGLFDDYTKSYKKGEVFTVEIDLQSEKPVKHGTLNIYFDHNKLRCTDLIFMNGEDGAFVNFDPSFQEERDKVRAVASTKKGYNYKDKKSFVTAAFELLDASAPASIEFDIEVLGLIMDESNTDLYENAINESVADSSYSGYYSFSVNESGSENPSGTTGDCKWEYSPSFFTLTISGNGKMQNYKKPSEIPWYSYAKEIKTIDISEDVKNIGSYAFRDTKIEQINIPYSVTEIGEAAFFNCSKLHRMSNGNGIKIIGAYAFANTDFTSIGFSKNIEKLGDYCFGYKEDVNTYRYVRVPDFEIIGYIGTEAERYANDNGFAFDAVDKPTEPTEPEAPEYYVAGNSYDIFDGYWRYTSKTNLMTLRSDGKYEKTYEVSKAYDGVQLKVASDGKRYGNKYGNMIYIDLTEAGSFTVIFDPDTEEVSVEGSIVQPHKIVVNKMYVAGDGYGNFLNGMGWNFDDSNIMKEVKPGVYEITYEGVDAADYQFKFAVNGKWDDNWGAETDDSIDVKAEAKAFFDGRNIHFTVSDDDSKVTLRISLKQFNNETLEGAKYAVIINDANIELLPDGESEKDPDPEEKPTEKETQKPTEKETEKATEKETEKATEKETEKETEKATDPTEVKPTEPTEVKPTEAKTEPTEVKPTEAKTEPAEVKPTEAKTEPTEEQKPTEAKTDPTEDKTETRTVKFLPGDEQLAEGSTLKLVIEDDKGEFHIYELTATPMSYGNIPVYSVSVPADIKPVSAQIQIYDGAERKSEVNISPELLGEGKLIASDGKPYTDESSPGGSALTKKNQTVQVKVKKVTVKANKLKKKTQTIKPFTVTKNKGKLSFKITKAAKAIKKYLKISKNGVITISKWKKAKKGTYTIKVRIIAKATKTYSRKTVNKTVSLKIK